MAVVCMMIVSSCTIKPNNSEQTDSSIDSGSDQTEPYVDRRMYDYIYDPMIYSEPARIDIRSDARDYFVPRVTNVEMSWREEWDYVDATISVSNCDDDEVLEDIAAQVKVRGNFTSCYIKKPYRIKFSKKQNMLGLNGGEKFKNWVLLADWKDSSMLRNATAFYLGKVILGSDGYYSSDYRPVELYINGDYRGMYLLCEQQQVNAGRIEIDEPASGYTGTDIGYLVEYDSYYEQEAELERFAISYYGDASNTFAQKGYSIKNDVYSRSQNEFIKNYIEKAYEICYRAVNGGGYYQFNSDFTRIIPSSATSAEEVVADVLDIDSLVDSYMLQEIVCDYDIAWSSFYMDVDMSETGEKLLRFEAPWDFDSAFGLRCMPDGRGLFAANGASNNFFKNPWLTLLVNEDWFAERVHYKWYELMKYDAFPYAFYQILDASDFYKDNYAANFNRWGGSLDTTEEPYANIRQFKTERQAAEYLYDWLYNRLVYLNRIWGDGSEFYTDLRR